MRIAIPTATTIDLPYNQRSAPAYASAVTPLRRNPHRHSTSPSPPAEILALARTCDGILLPGSPADVDPAPLRPTPRTPPPPRRRRPSRSRRLPPPRSCRRHRQAHPRHLLRSPVPQRLGRRLPHSGPHTPPCQPRSRQQSSHRPRHRHRPRKPSRQPPHPRRSPPHQRLPPSPHQHQPPPGRSRPRRKPPHRSPLPRRRRHRSPRTSPQHPPGSGRAHRHPTRRRIVPRGNNCTPSPSPTPTHARNCSTWNNPAPNSSWASNGIPNAPTKISPRQPSPLRLRLIAEAKLHATQSAAAHHPEPPQSSPENTTSP